MKQKYSYTREFYASVDSRAMETAEEVLRIISKFTEFDSVIDVGCGSGAWIRASLKLGKKVVYGVDLPSSLVLIKDQSDFQSYLKNRSLILIERDLVEDHNTALPKAEIGICLEVVEHLPDTVSKSLIQLLTDSAKIVIFSAAQPGQGGTYHINEMPLEYWVSEFSLRGFEVFDPFRDSLEKNRNAPRFYALNTLLFVKTDAWGDASTAPISEELRMFRIQDLKYLDRRTKMEKVRYWFVKFLPVRVVTLISKRFKYS